MKQREHWKSRMGFVWAATGSAVGLGSIWRFPYVVGQNGGAAFVLLFCLFLFLVSLPVLISEILIGRKTQLSPQGGYEQIAKGWGKAGFITILTGFIVSSFYSVICGWTLGYLIEALLGNLTHFAKASETVLYFTKLSGSPSWSLGCHFAFMAFSLFVLYFGVQKGIERANKVMMPLLFGILFLLVIKGLMMPNAHEGLKFLFTPNWQALTPQAIITALGQAFFGLSLGQGTMVTYGSYLNKKVDVLALCLPIALSVTIVSLLAGVAIFTVVFSAGVEPTSGTNLMFQTLPIIFSNMPGGHALAVLFFLLIFVAGLTSQISAMEPSISYLIDTYGVKRHKASFFVALGSFLLGIPSALAFGVLGDVKVFGMNIFDAISALSINILIPIGGLFAVILVGWKWGLKKAIEHMKEGLGAYAEKLPFLEGYLRFSIKYLSPIVILFILLNSIGIL